MWDEHAALPTTTFTLDLSTLRNNGNITNVQLQHTLKEGEGKLGARPSLCLFLSFLNNIMNILSLTSPDSILFYCTSCIFFAAGLYHLFFTRCSSKPFTVSFSLIVEFYNPGPDYLGVGEAQLPVMYYLLTIAYAAGNFLWFFVMAKNNRHYHR